jgi:DNA-binding MurR/RpiR family transcriptional regulator
MATRLALRIQERFEKLSPSERKLAALLLERQDDVLTYSATEMAELAGVSKATAARLFRSLGYNDFNDVRLQAREERNRTAPFHQLKTVAAEPLGARSISAHLAAEVASLTRTFEDLRSDHLALAADMIAEAPRVWLMGLGLEEGLVRHARLLLSRVRPDVQVLGLQPGAWGEDLAMTGPRVALGLGTAGPRPRILRPILDYARTTRTQVVTLTDPVGALWAARLSSVVLACHASGADVGGSSTSFTSMLRLIVLATAERIGRASARRGDLIADIHEELDDQE